MSPLILPHGGKHPKIAADAFIAPNAVIIGDVEIGPRASIWFGCVLRGDTNSIRVGAGTNIQDGTVIHVNEVPEGVDPATPGYRTEIGAGITVGHMALLHACILQDNSFVGMRACIIDGAVVESGAMVAAGALVTPGKRVKHGELWAGSPAKPMRPLAQAEIDDFAESARHYCELAESYRTRSA
ncbi:MAG: gamma-carbonic anhydrase [Rhodospirillaceae bacterium]|jgi:carbonic anhydrase/acetyltransferase-like protein (isoleucine patch superfamily)|nr:gamma-carbonic anhydrase [Rhodospirillaceae bacterium]